MKLRSLAFASAWLITALCQSASAQLAPDAARAVLAKVEPAVVSVRVVLKMTTAMEGRESGKQDHEIEVTGCVVSDKGLTVVSLSLIDPAAMYEEMYKDLSEDAPDFKFQSEVTDLKIRYAGGAEVAGEVAIRDKDLDVAILRPKAALATPSAFVDFASAATADILDPLILVTRLGKDVSWTTVARVGVVNGILTKPRRMYLLSGGAEQVQADFGALAVASDGKPLGVQLVRKVPSTSARGPEILAVVLPASDILAIVKQLPQ